MQPSTTGSRKRLTLRRSRAMLMAAIAIALAALATACSAPSQHPATSRSTAGTTAEHHRGDPGDQQHVTAKLTTVAEFPVGFFLENVAVRADGSMLVTELSKKGLWYLPAPTSDAPVQPQLLYTFDQPPFDLVETERDVFYVDTSSYLTRRDSYLQRVDLRHWVPGMLVPVQT